MSDSTATDANPARAADPSSSDANRAIAELEDRYLLPTYDKMPLAIERGEGAHVWDAEGRRYLDFYGGHAVTALGHCPPRVVEAIRDQVAQLIFYSNVAYNGRRARTARRLVEVAPDGIVQVFFANSGSEANETALKLARTFTGRSKVVAARDGFHGRTIGSLAATWGEKYRGPYESILPPVEFVPFGDAEAAAETLEREDDVAAFLLEPIQSIAGVREAPAEYFQALRALCDRHGVVLCFDEVQTGVGRTGTFSIAHQLGMEPDLISLAKSLGSGAPVSAVLATREIADTVDYGDQGSTFGGGMIAMAAVEATLRAIEEDDLMDRAAAIHERIREEVGPHVEEVRGRGCLIGLELAGPAAPVRSALREEGILVGGAGPKNVIRLMPPMTATEDDVDRFVAGFEAAVSTVVP